MTIPAEVRARLPRDLDTHVHVLLERLPWQRPKRSFARRHPVLTGLLALGGAGVAAAAAFGGRRAFRACCGHADEPADVKIEGVEDVENPLNAQEDPVRDIVDSVPVHA